MAIDTAPKRRNVASLMPPFGVGVTPTASKGVDWRQAVGWGYLGIDATVPFQILDLDVVVTAAYALAGTVTQPYRLASTVSPDYGLAVTVTPENP